MSAALDPAPLRKWTDLPPNYVRTLAAPHLFVPQGPKPARNYQGSQSARRVQYSRKVPPSIHPSVVRHLSNSCKKLSLHAREYQQNRPTVSSYQTWWSKYHMQHPNYNISGMKEKYGPHRQTQWPFEDQPSSTKWSTDPAFRVEYPKPQPVDMFHSGGRPVTETKRGRAQYGLYGTYNIYNNDHLYPYSNAMTGANHRRPVFSAYGPLLKDKYCGMDYRSNNHGYMKFDDHY